MPPKNWMLRTWTHIKLSPLRQPCSRRRLRNAARDTALSLASALSEEADVDTQPAILPPTRCIGLRSRIHLFPANSTSVDYFSSRKRSGRPISRCGFWLTDQAIAGCTNRNTGGYPRPTQIDARTKCSVQRELTDSSNMEIIMTDFIVDPSGKITDLRSRTPNGEVGVQPLSTKLNRNSGESDRTHSSRDNPCPEWQS